MLFLLDNFIWKVWLQLTSSLLKMGEICWHQMYWTVGSFETEDFHNISLGSVTSPVWRIQYHSVPQKLTAQIRANGNRMAFVWFTWQGYHVLFLARWHCRSCKLSVEEQSGSAIRSYGQESKRQSGKWICCILHEQYGEVLEFTI
jgi:hypothetical protein